MITLTKDEYAKLLEAKKKLSIKRENVSFADKKKEFLDKAFGILQKGFGKGSSSSHVAKIRASWRG